MVFIVLDFYFYLIFNLFKKLSFTGYGMKGTLSLEYSKLYQPLIDTPTPSLQKQIFEILS